MVEARAAEAQHARTRLRLLDGLRFLAAVAVVLFHYTGRDSPGWGEPVREVFPGVSSLTIYGLLGPYLFFMISGFVVLMTAWGRPFRTFVASRVARLYPAYWVAVIFTAVVVFLDRDLFGGLWEQLRLPGVLLNLTMLQSAFGVPHVDGVYWTLWVELKFYLLLGALVVVGITRRRLLVLCFAWPVLAALAARTGATLLAELLEPNYAPFFCIGILIFLVHREGWTLPVAFLLAVNWIFALWVAYSYIGPWAVDVAGYPISFSATAVLITAMIGVLIAVTTTRLALVDATWLTLLGALTYPLYLLHEFPGWSIIAALRPSVPPAVIVLICVVLMVGAAYLVHRFIERPTGQRLRRVIESSLLDAGLRDRS